MSDTEKDPTLKDINKKLNTVLEELEARTIYGKIKLALKRGNEAIVAAAIVVFFSLVGSAWHFIQAPLQAQITDDIRHVHEVPVLQGRIEHLDDAVTILREEHKEFRKTLKDQNTVLQQILRNTKK